MFRKYTLVSALSVTLTMLVAILGLCVVRKSDIEKYRKTLKTHETLSSQPLAETAQQTRQGVQKDIWFSQEDASRLHYKIQSESSLLTLVPTEKKFEIVENLQKIKCWMQEKLYLANPGEPMQQVRFLEAQDGVYRYNQQQFLANTVALSLFRLKGHELITPVEAKKAFLKGLAEDVSFAVSGKTPQFKAHNFKATLSQEDLP